MGAMGKDFQSLEKEMEYYASKLHQVEKGLRLVIFMTYH